MLFAYKAQSPVTYDVPLPCQFMNISKKTLKGETQGDILIEE